MCLETAALTSIHSRAEMLRRATPALGRLASRRLGRGALWVASAYIEDLARRRRAGGASGSGGSSGSASAWAALRERRVRATPLAVAVSLSRHAECSVS